MASRQHKGTSHKTQKRRRGQRHPQRMTVSLPPIRSPSLKKLRTIGILNLVRRALSHQHDDEMRRLLARYRKFSDGNPNRL